MWLHVNPFAVCKINEIDCFLSYSQISGPIKERDGRVRHFKGLGEQVQRETSLGNTPLDNNTVKP